MACGESPVNTKIKPFKNPDKNKILNRSLDFLKGVLEFDSDNPENRTSALYTSKIAEIFEKFNYYHNQFPEYIPKRWKIASPDKVVQLAIEKIRKANPFLGEIVESHGHSERSSNRDVRRRLIIFENGAVEIFFNRTKWNTTILFQVAANQPINEVKFKAKTEQNIVTYVIDGRFLYNENIRSFRKAVSFDVRNLFLIQEAYPFIHDIWDFLYEYLRSDDPLLLLSGEPGTGKSYLLSYLFPIFNEAHEVMKNIKDNRILRYIKGITEINDWYPVYVTPGAVEVFELIVFEGNNFILIDDGAELLNDRSELTSESAMRMVNTILALAGGFIFSKLKTVFTFNEHIKIDPAILRPGRTFDHIAFRKLNPDEANRFLEKYSKVFQVDPFEEIKEPVTLAELFQIIRRRKTKRFLEHRSQSKLGFV